VVEQERRGKGDTLGPFELIALVVGVAHPPPRSRL
jgi:hypothetical protein